MGNGTVEYGTKMSYNKLECDGKWINICFIKINIGTVWNMKLIYAINSQ